MNENIDEVTSRKSKDFQSFLTYNSRKAVEEDEQFNAAYDFLRYGGPKAQFGQEMYQSQPVHGYVGVNPMMANAIRQQEFQDNQDLQAMNSLFSNKLVQDGAKTVGGLAVSGAKAVGRGVGNMFGNKAYGGPVKKYQKGGPKYGQVNLEKYQDPNDELAYLKAVKDKYGKHVLNEYEMNPYSWNWMGDQSDYSYEKTY